MRFQESKSDSHPLRPGTVWGIWSDPLSSGGKCRVSQAVQGVAGSAGCRRQCRMSQASARCRKQCRVSQVVQGVTGSAGSKNVQEFPGVSRSVQECQAPLKLRLFGEYGATVDTCACKTDSKRRERKTWG